MTYKLLTPPRLTAYLLGQLSPKLPFKHVEILDFTPVWMDKVVFIVHREWNFGSWGRGYRVSCPITGGSLQRGPSSPTKDEEVKQLYMHFNHMKWNFKEVSLKCRGAEKVFTPNAQDWIDYEKRINFSIEQGIL